MEFGYDPAKRESNLAKHGVDFVDVFAAVGVIAQRCPVAVPRKAGSGAERLP
jgi:uncharacterized DUF497 family protein